MNTRTLALLLAALMLPFSSAFAQEESHEVVIEPDPLQHTANLEILVRAYEDLVEAVNNDQTEDIVAYTARIQAYVHAERVWANAERMRYELIRGTDPRPGRITDQADDCLVRTLRYGDVLRLKRDRIKQGQATNENPSGYNTETLTESVRHLKHWDREIGRCEEMLRRQLVEESRQYIRHHAPLDQYIRDHGSLDSSSR